MSWSPEIVTDAQAPTWRNRDGMTFEQGAGIMRLAFVCLLLAACDRMPSSHVDPVPDADIVNDCEGTTLQLVAPVEGEHYDPANLIAQIAISTFYVDDGFSTEIYDDAGNTFQPTGAPTIADLGDDTDSATWHFANLAPGTRYTWDVSAVDCDRAETFFTN
jgi:hypothetical protein